MLVNEESGGRVHVGAHAEPPSGLLANGELIAGDHLDVDTEVERLANGLSTIMPWWVEEGEQAQELPRRAITVLACLGHFLSRNAQRPEPAFGEFVDHLVDLLLGIPLEVAKFNDLFRGALAGPEPLAAAVDVGNRRSLLDWIEGQEVHFLDPSPRLFLVTKFKEA